MRKRYRILLAMLFGGLIGVVVWGVLLPREPSYQGRRLSAWLAQLDKELPQGNYLRTNGPAATAIQQIGTNAIPHLRRMLGAKDSHLMSKLIDLSGKQTLTKIHVTTANDWRRRAAFATFALGARGSPLLPTFMSLFREKNYETAFMATTILGCIGYCNPNTLPALIVALEDEAPDVRARAAFALNQLNTCFQLVDVEQLHIIRESRCKAAVPALLKAASGPDGPVRRNAVMALDQIDAEAAAKARLN